jgi:uncharacterized protein YlzI (FlbEa/FlbD family)
MGRQAVMPYFIQISSNHYNIATIERIDEAADLGGCTLVFRNGDKVRVEEDVRQVIDGLAQAEAGRTVVLTSPQPPPRVVRTKCKMTPDGRHQYRKGINVCVACQEPKPGS